MSCCVGGGLLLEGHKPGSIADICPQGRDFSFSAYYSPLPPQGFERLYPEVRVLQQHLRGWQ